VISFEAMLEAGTIDKSDLDLFEFAESAEEIWARLLALGMPVAAKGAQLK
jgi:hypothetical protein